MPPAAQDEEEARGLVSSAPPESRPFSLFSVQGMRQRVLNETNFCIVATVIWIMTVAICVLTFIFYPWGLIPLALFFWLLAAYRVSYYYFPMFVSVVLFLLYYAAHGAPTLVVQLKR